MLTKYGMIKYLTADCIQIL